MIAPPGCWPCPSGCSGGRGWGRPASPPPGCRSCWAACGCRPISTPAPTPPAAGGRCGCCGGPTAGCCATVRCSPTAPCSAPAVGCSIWRRCCWASACWVSPWARPGPPNWWSSCECSGSSSVPSAWRPWWGWRPAPGCTCSRTATPGPTGRVCYAGGAGTGAGEKVEPPPDDAAPWVRTRKPASTPWRS
jgi:hypothetical protein